MPDRRRLESANDISRAHLGPLTGVRFLLAFHVILFHFVGVFEGWPRRLQEVVASGYVAVSAFFVLSGFILTYTYGSPAARRSTTARDFWAARFARIYPLYLLAFLLVVALWALIPRGQSVPDFFKPSAALAHLLAAQPWIPGWVLTWNVPAWSVGVELFFYLVFPFIAWRLLDHCATRPSLLRLAAVMWFAGNLGPTLYLLTDPDGSGSLGGGLTQGISPQGFWLDVVRFQPLLRLPEFVMGIAIGGLYLLDLREGKHRNGTLIAGVAAAVVLLTLAYSSEVPYVLLHNAALAPAFAALVFGLAHGSWLLARLLANPALLVLGGASFAMYILQFPVGAPFFAGGVEAITLQSLAVYLIFLIVLSILASKLVEKPARRYLKRIASRSAAAVSPSEADAGRARRLSSATSE